MRPSGLSCVKGKVGPRYLSASQIAALAAEFRERYAPGAVGALDIEAILEHDLGLQIVPRKNLSRMTGKKGWLSFDGRSVSVDEGLMCGSLGEYRFTITHEVAHFVLHRELLPERPPQNEEEFWIFHNQWSERDQWFLEWQAREWAGQVLVPPNELRHVFEHATVRALRIFGRPMEALQLYVAQEVAEHFGVTAACASVRISKDGLWRAIGVAA